MKSNYTCIPMLYIPKYTNTCKISTYLPKYLLRPQQKWYFRRKSLAGSCSYNYSSPSKTASFMILLYYNLYLEHWQTTQSSPADPNTKGWQIRLFFFSTKYGIKFQNSVFIFDSLITLNWLLLSGNQLQLWNEETSTASHIVSFLQWR